MTSPVAPYARSADATRDSFVRQQRGTGNPEMLRRRAIKEYQITKQKAQEAINALEGASQGEAALARLKYGNLDKDVDEVLTQAEDPLSQIQGRES